MLSKVKQLFDESSKDIKRITTDVELVNGYESTFESYSDEELSHMTDIFLEKLQNGATVHDIKHEAFAIVREASKRVLGQRHYDVQIMGGFALLEGNIAQMSTGEGKTLVSTLPSYLLALEQKGVHIITANEYLAKRDHEQMGQIHQFLGLKVGLNISQMEGADKKQAYEADITYGTGTEFGFDYLRDNMVNDISQKVQRGHHYAIVDEIDSILIDEARTPLIIANQSSEGAELFKITAIILDMFKKDIDYELFAETKQVYLTDEGAAKIERSFGIDNLYEADHLELLHHVTQSLKAKVIMSKDVDYIVKEGKIVIVDKFTGRVMDGRSFSDGLHQAIEAKERIEITEENETKATITIQNYFRMYAKLCGMTGSATPSRREFFDTYHLHVMTIPTNKPCIRIDTEDEVYMTYADKVKRIVEVVKDCHKRKQPVLIGTTSIEQSEKLSKHLSKFGIKHRILNAKTEEDEAKIISLAGQSGQVMLATNMAGRGTDIILGEGVKELGGLHIIGTERHESNRIDMQLRGRAGRQGDPGSSRFIISLEDDLFLYYDEEQFDRYKKKAKTDEKGLIIQPDPVNFVKKVQETVENMHFSSRNHLLKLDNVLDQQSKVIYSRRDRILTLSEDVMFEELLQYMQHYMNHAIELYVPENLDERNYAALKAELMFLLIDFNPSVNDLEEMEVPVLEEYLKSEYERTVAVIEELRSVDTLSYQLKQFMLSNIDFYWIQHLHKMTAIKEGIMLRSYAQEDPYRHFENDALEGFKDMMFEIESGISMRFMEFAKSLLPKLNGGTEEE